MKSFFKLKVLLLLVLILISTNIGLRASHIIGAEIHYKQIEGNNYRFTLKVYRDCNECKFDNNGGGNNSKSCPDVPNLKVKGALNSIYGGIEYGEVVMTRTRIEDKTPTCYSAISKCKNGANINYGYELQEFEGSFNFNTLVLSGKCEFDVSIGVSSRNAAINSSGTEQNFFNFAYINLCHGVENKSTRFDLSPTFVLLQNQTHSIALGVVNEDQDSLSFKLRPALLNRGNNVSYNVGRNYTQPYGVYCLSGAGCPPNHLAPLAEGFYISEVTGDIVFTPVMLNEGGVIVVECEEWKKDNQGKSFLAGITRRDIYAEVISPANNLPKIKNSVLQIDLCEGEPFILPVHTEDLKLYGLFSDSVQINVISDLSDLTLTKNSLASPPYNFYRLDLSNTLNRKGKYLITIKATDNNCPLKGSSSKTILLNIKGKRLLDYNVKTKNCGLLQIEDKLKNRNIQWVLSDINNTELKRQIGPMLTYQLANGGKYILKASIDATDVLCALNIQDTITIVDFKKPEFEIGEDVTTCKNNVLNIEPSVLNTFDTYKVFLENSEITFPYSYKAINNKKLTFKVIQNNGCFSEDNMKINVFPELSKSFLKDTICSNFDGDFDIDNLLVADRSLIKFIDIASVNNEISLNKIDNLNYSLKIIVPQRKRLKLTSIITDVNGCNYLDTFYLEMIDPKPINIVLSDKICANVKSLLLPSGANGSWKCLNYPGNVTGSYLNLQPPFSGEIELEYSENNQCLNSKLYNVTILDTSAIAISGGVNLVLCENAGPLTLNATPANGKWEGNFINQNVFYPFPAKNTKNTILYKYTNSSGCISTSLMQIEVVGLPSLSVESNKSTICVGDELKLTANTGVSSIDGYWTSAGDGQFDHPHENSTAYKPSANDIRNGSVSFTYTIQTNTVCGNISKGIDVNIMESPSGKIIADYSLNKCEPADFKFKTNFTNITKQNWYVNDSLMEEFDYAFDLGVVLRAGVYRIKTEVMNGECASVALSEPIEVYSTPVSNFIANPSNKLSREYPRLYLKDITTNRNPFSSAWYFNNVLIDNSKEFYYNIETPNDTFNIKLVNVSAVGGCENSISRQFLFSPINQLYIPDAFSPDTKGPDENNEFKVKGPVMQFFYIEIFNKWGEMVYFSREMNASWDGLFGGKPAMAGVYFYKINSTDMDGVSRDYSGTVTLIR